MYRYIGRTLILHELRCPLSAYIVFGYFYSFVVKKKTKKFNRKYAPGTGHGGHKCSWNRPSPTENRGLGVARTFAPRSFWIYTRSVCVHCCTLYSYCTYEYTYAYKVSRIFHEHATSVSLDGRNITSKYTRILVHALVCTSTRVSWPSIVARSRCSRVFHIFHSKLWFMCVYTYVRVHIYEYTVCVCTSIYDV